MASQSTPNPSPLPDSLLSRSVFGALFAVYIVWGATSLGTDIALESYPPFMLLAMRLLLASVILIAFLKIRSMSFPSSREALIATAIGGLMFGGRAGFLTFAQQQGLGFGMISLGIATVPLWALIFSYFWGYRSSKPELLALVIGMAGMAILTAGSDFVAQPVALAILLFSPMIWAFGSMSSKYVTMPSGLMSPAFQMVGGCVVLVVMSLLRGEQFPTEPSLPATTAFLFLAVLGTLVAFTAYMYLVRNVSPGLATSYAYVNPVVAVIFEVIVIGETLPPTAILALIVIATSVILLMVGRSTRLYSA